MRILLDSHAFLWFVLRKPQLSRSADAMISDPSNVVLVSPATCWEIAIKVGKNKLELMASYDDFMRQGIEGNDFTILLQALGLVNLHLRIHVSEQRSVPPVGLTTDSTDNTDNEFTIFVPSVSSVVSGQRSVRPGGLTTDSTDNTDVQGLLTRIVARTAHIRATISV